MKKYTQDEKYFLKSNIKLKDSFFKGEKVDQGTKEFKKLAAMQKEFYNQIVTPGCASCMTDLFKNLFNKLREELEEDANTEKPMKKERVQAVIPTPHKDETSITHLQKAYRKKHGKDAANRYKNDIEWLKSKV